MYKGKTAKLQALKPNIKPMPARLNTPTSERIKGTTLQNINDRIAKRDNYTCQICHKFTTTYEIDHKIPLDFGGGNNLENLHLLCISCHAEKSAREERERNGNNIL